MGAVKQNRFNSVLQKYLHCQKGNILNLNTVEQAANVATSL